MITIREQNRFLNLTLPITMVTTNPNNFMETKKPLTSVTLFFFFFFFFFKSISGKDDCTPSSCSPTGPQIRFPFRLRNRQPAHCGFPGFDLTCNNKNQTLLILPSSQSFIVNHISYVLQVINIEPDFCSPERLADIRLTGTPFDYSFVQSYTFYNCSSRDSGFPLRNVQMIRFPCLGSVNHSVFAVQTFSISRGYRLENCSVMTTVMVPIRKYDDISNELTLIWLNSFCSICESDGRSCGFKSDDGETGCFGSSSHGIPRGAKYGLTLGIGVPALVCVIGLLFYVFSKVSTYNRGQLQSVDLFSITVTPQPPSTTGLDGPTIQSYPKSVLGESCRLPKDDGTCPICLSDYEPKESVRTIPECNHYFHADCIDQWLKLNATCPICRNSPETSSLVTPCFSVSSNSSNSTHATTQL